MNSEKTREARWKWVLPGLAAVGLFWLSAAMAVQPSGPDKQAFQNARQDKKNWILPARTYDGNRYIQEDEISKENIGDLKRSWTFELPTEAPVETSPIIWHGVVYVTTGHDDIYALDGGTGELKWKFQPKPTQIVGFARNRGIALLNGRVFIATIDGHLIAVDAQTGEKVWDKLEVHNPKDSFYSMQPVPYKGMLLLGVSNGDWGGIGNISAFDPETGKRIWQWDTIPGPGEPGHDTWSGDSWKRGGAAVWSGLAIDPDTDTLYLDLGNPQPDLLGTFRKGKNLYTDSMVALDISGSKPKMKWYHQFIAHDTHDWDPAMPPVLFNAKVGDDKRMLVAAGDKAGNFWVLDAKTGKLVEHTPVSYQYHQDTAPSEEGVVTCPSTNGGVEYNGGTYDPATNTFFVPSISQCGRWQAHAKAVYIAGQFYLGGGFPQLLGPSWGWFNAVNLSTGVFNWRHHFDLPANGGALVMGDGSNSLVFTGELGGDFDAFDANNGDRLWHADTGASIVAPPATYVQAGNRYVVIASGPPGFLKVPDIEKKTGPAVVTAFTVKSNSSGGESTSN